MSRKKDTTQAGIPNLIKELLRTKYKANQLDALMKLINVSPNEIVAAEMLAGIWQEPKVNPQPHKKFLEEYKSQHDITFKSYNEWDNVVVSTHYRVQTVQCWLPKELKKDEYPSYDMVKSGEFKFLYPTSWRFSDTKFHEEGKEQKDYDYVTIQGEVDYSHKYSTETPLKFWNEGVR
jgi:hypothetical protein